MTPTPIPTQPENQHQSIRLFENDLLERLSHVHPITPLLMWGPIAGYLIWRSFAIYHLPVLPVLAIGLAGDNLERVLAFSIPEFRSMIRTMPGHWPLPESWS